MRKRLVSVFMSILCVFGCMSAFAGCNTNKEKIVQDGKTVNVRLFLGGFGSEFLTELKDKFEAAYADEGYKINILTPSNDNNGTVVINELASKNSGVDLYITEAVPVKDVVDGDYGLLVEDLTETVYDKPAIGFDGKEESKTVREKANAGNGVLNETNAYYNGKEYGFCWAASAGGMAVNTEKLSRYGIEKIPNTTDKLIDAFEKIYNGTTLSDGTAVSGSRISGIYPHTFVSGSSGYPEMMYRTHLAQGMGLDGLKRFMSFTDENGEEMVEDGYTLYEDPAIKDMLAAAYRVFDVTYATNGSTTQDADTANSRVAVNNSGAVFMTNGSWMLNEVKLNYPEAKESLRFVNIPVISALGTKVFGAGTSAGITDKEECDDLLSYVIDLVDEGKNASEIVSAVSANKSKTITEDDAKRIIEARNLYFSRSYLENAYIAKDSPVKDVAALFLRMYASDDFAKVFSQSANATTPFDSRTDAESEYAFVNDAAKFVNKSGAVAFNGVAESSGLRKKTGTNVLIYGKNYLALTIVNERVSKYNASGVLTGSDSVYDVAAQKMYEDNIANIKNQWSVWMENAGY